MVGWVVRACGLGVSVEVTDGEGTDMRVDESGVACGYMCLGGAKGYFISFRSGDLMP